MLAGAKMYPPVKMMRYPHMFPKDIEIWERFLEKYATEYDGFIYDWKVGSGTEPVPELREPYATMQTTLSKYRVDVIGVKAGRYELIETKPNAGPSAVGQIISYRNLFVKDYQGQREVVPVIVTDFERPDIREVASDMGVKYYIV